MRVATATTVLAGFLGVASFGATAAEAAGGNLTTAATAGGGPTPAQVAKAIHNAETSKSLWATINICDTRDQPNVLGVRGQMPSLGFPAWLSMEIHLAYYDKTQKRWVTDPGTQKTIRLGRSAHGLQQGGATYTFPGATPQLQASVRFVWRRSGNLLGTTQQLTAAGHPQADFGSPPRYSAATCTIH